MPIKCMLTADRFCENLLKTEAADIFSESLEKIHRSEAESQTLANLRDTLLPKLLSGELRVPEAEKQVEEVV